MENQKYYWMNKELEDLQLFFKQSPNKSQTWDQFWKECNERITSTGSIYIFKVHSQLGTLLECYILPATEVFEIPETTSQPAHYRVFFNEPYPFISNGSKIPLNEIIKVDWKSKSFTDIEHLVLDKLGEVWNAYSMLPKEVMDGHHVDDTNDFRYHIHRLQDLLVARMGYRELRRVRTS